MRHSRIPELQLDEPLPHPGRPKDAEEPKVGQNVAALHAPGEKDKMKFG